MAVVYKLLLYSCFSALFWRHCSSPFIT